MQMIVCSNGFNINICGNKTFYYKDNNEVIYKTYSEFLTFKKEKEDEFMKKCLIIIIMKIFMN